MKKFVLRHFGKEPIPQSNQLTRALNLFYSQRELNAFIEKLLDESNKKYFSHP